MGGSYSISLSPAWCVCRFSQDPGAAFAIPQDQTHKAKTDKKKQTSCPHRQHQQGHRRRQVPRHPRTTKSGHCSIPATECPPQAQHQHQPTNPCHLCHGEPSSPAGPHHSKHQPIHYLHYHRRQKLQNHSRPYLHNNYQHHTNYQHHNNNHHTNNHSPSNPRATATATD